MNGILTVVRDDFSLKEKKPMWLLLLLFRKEDVAVEIDTSKLRRLLMALLTFAAG